jgi:type II secretory pathway pseudopilin PulG
MLHSRASTRRGFTLIELLTVAGIAIVLATLVVTAIFAAQESGRNANCRSNLSQIHKLMMVYTQTYGNFLPAFWHERWAGELGLFGGAWRSDTGRLKNRPHIRYMWDQWYLFLKAGGRTFRPPSDGGSQAGATYWNNIRNRLYSIYIGSGYPKLDNLDDVNPLMPMVWNNYQAPGHYLGGSERCVYRSSAQAIMCPSDTSAYRCDQGGLISYMGLAKYGWWHRGDCPTVARYYEYHQIQEVDQPSKRWLLGESEPGTWQYGGCG